MSKVATITFQNADNYGAILQCYALQKAIRNLGVECNVIDYDCEYLSKPWKYAALKRKGIIRFCLGVINSKLRKLRKKEFDDFRELIPKTITVGKKDIGQLNNQFDMFIAGSDQIWNYDLTDFDTTYLLDFVDDKHKKNSYAASFGFSEIKKEYMKKYKTLLDEFENIAVREKSANSIIKNLINKECPIVLDPTLLLSSDDWDNVIKEPSVKGKYIFLYQASTSKKLIKVAKEIQKKTGLRIISAPFPMGLPGRFSVDITCGPQRWIGYIKNADYVITDSFHGTVFSLIYEKNLYVCLNDYSTRVTNLLEMVGKVECIVESEKVINLQEKRDYAVTKSLIMKEREKSIMELRKIVMGD